jgi:hypothetical protein
MAYRKESYVNWCEPCQTVLANEQVEAGMCWRCGKPVRQKKLWQWFFKITDFAEDLLVHCDMLPGWPDKVTTMQRNWIGKSVGAEIRFPVEGSQEVISRVHHAPGYGLWGHLHVPGARTPAGLSWPFRVGPGIGRDGFCRAHLPSGALQPGHRKL